MQAIQLLKLNLVLAIQGPMSLCKIKASLFSVPIQFPSCCMEKGNTKTSIAGKYGATIYTQIV